MRRMKKAGLAAIGVAVFALAGCASNGWDALPTDEKSKCVQVTEWSSNGWTTHTEALGLYCEAKP